MMKSILLRQPRAVLRRLGRSVGGSAQLRTVASIKPTLRNCGRKPAAYSVGVFAAGAALAACALVAPLNADTEIKYSEDEEPEYESLENDEKKKTTVKVHTTTTTTTKPNKKANDDKKRKQVVAKKQIEAVKKKLAAQNKVATVDPEKMLFAKNRVVFVTSGIEIKMARTVIAQLLYLDSVSDEPIQMVINTGGGVVSDGLAIYDTMKAIKAPVHTYVVGRASSMGAIIAAGGEHGHRYALPHSRMMIHELSSVNGRSKISDLRIRIKNSEELNEILIGCLSLDTGKSKKQLRQLMERDYYMTPDEAVRFNIIDHVVKNFKVYQPKKK